MSHNLRFEVFDADNTAHIAAAQRIRQWQKDEGPRMLPLGPEEMAAHVYGLMAFDADSGEILGYNAAMNEYPGGVLEIGGLFVSQEHRGRGIAKAIKIEILARMDRDFPDKTLLTFVNESSEHVNREMGFTDGDIKTVPGEALTECQKCPAYCALQVGQLCCDKILVRYPGALA